MFGTEHLVFLPLCRRIVIRFFASAIIGQIIHNSRILKSQAPPVSESLCRYGFTNPWRRRIYCRSSPLIDIRKVDSKAGTCTAFRAPESQCWCGCTRRDSERSRQNCRAHPGYNPRYCPHELSARFSFPYPAQRKCPVYRR